MPHDISLITTLAAALGLALLFGFIAARLIESECECRVFLGESELANAMTERVLASANVGGA